MNNSEKLPGVYPFLMHREPSARSTLMNGIKSTSYPPELREVLAKLTVESGQPVQEISKALGMRNLSLQCWVNDYRHKSRPDTLRDANDHLIKETEKLREEIQTLKQEREILAKAMAITARELLSEHCLFDT